MASIPPSGLDLWVTFPKVKIKEAKVEHFYLPQILLYDISGWICQGKYDLSLSGFLKTSRGEKVETILAGSPPNFRMRSSSRLVVSSGIEAGPQRVDFSQKSL